MKLRSKDNKEEFVQVRVSKTLKLKFNIAKKRLKKKQVDVNEMIRDYLWSIVSSKDSQ